MNTDINKLKERLSCIDKNVDWFDVADATGINYNTVRKYVRGKGTMLSNYIAITKIADDLISNNMPKAI